MNWLAVDSTNLEAIKYDHNRRILHIKFRNGSEYEFSNLPQKVYEGLLKSDSKGSYFQQYIKGYYLYKRLS